MIKLCDEQSFKLWISSIFFFLPTVVCVQVCLLFLVFCIATNTWFAYRPPDVVALMFCCTHKSLTLGK